MPSQHMNPNDAATLKAMLAEYTFPLDWEARCAIAVSMQITDFLFEKSRGPLLADFENDRFLHNNYRDGRQIIASSRVLATLVKHKAITAADADDIMPGLENDPTSLSRWAKRFISAGTGIAWSVKLRRTRSAYDQCAGGSLVFQVANPDDLDSDAVEATYDFIREIRTHRHYPDSTSPCVSVREFGFTFQMRSYALHRYAFGIRSAVLALKERIAHGEPQPSVL